MANSQNHEFLLNVQELADLRAQCAEQEKQIDMLTAEKAELLKRWLDTEAENKGQAYLSGQLAEAQYENARLQYQLNEAEARAAIMEEALQEIREELQHYQEAEQRRTSVLEQPISVLGSMHGMGCQLRRRGIATLGDLTQVSPHEMRNWVNVGDGRIQIVADVLEAYGERHGVELTLAP